jgi:hypothetical protein
MPHKASTTPASVTKTVTVAAPLASASANAPASVAPRRGLQETMCGGRADCVVKTDFAGAPGKDGDARAVVLVPTKLSVSAGDEKPVECAGNEVWLVRTTGDGTVVDRQLVGEGCAEDTPYGVACDGLTMIAVEPPKLALPTTATVAWEGPGPGCGGWTRASGDIEVSLDTFAALRRNEWSARAREPDDTHSTHWDFTTWSFTAEWQTSSSDCPDRKRGPSLNIPKLALGSAFLDGAWQTASLNECATTIEATRGVALPGTTKSKGLLRAVVSETDALFVDVVEAPLAKPGGTLQVCFAEWSGQSYDYCHIPIAPECVRVALDGHVLSGKTTVTRAPEQPRFRVQLPPQTTAIGVSYLEAGGRSISSTAYRRGDATSLGRILSFGPAVATCHLEGTALQRTTPRPKDEDALLSSEDLE